MDDDAQETLEQNQEPSQSDPGEASAAPQSDGPTNLADAFRLLRENERGSAQGSVEPSDQQISSGSDAGVGSQEDTSAVSTGSGADAGLGGSTDGAVEAAPTGDVAADTKPTGSQQQVITGQSIRENLAQQAVQIAQDEFARRKFRPYSMGDLYHRDEKTGRVTFDNPDDPNRPFTSRYEAQQFIDAFNKDLESEQRKFAQGVMNDLLRQNKDFIELAEFVPTYQAMDPATQQVFEALVAPYESRSKNGAIVFPGANFNLLAQQARNIAQLSAQQQTTVQENSQVSVPKKDVGGGTRGPALDLKGGAGGIRDDAPVTNLNEAMKRINAKRAADRNNSKKGGKR